MNIIIKMKKNKITAMVGNKKVGNMKFGHPDDASGKRNVCIDEIWVSPKYRRRGIATKILKYFLKKFKNVIWISFWTGRQMEIDKAYKLFTKLGFKKIAHHPDYYAKGIGTRLYSKRIKK